MSHQPSHKLIVSVSGHPVEKDKVQISAFSDSDPHELVNQLSIDMEHYFYSMFPQSKSTSTDSIILALCTPASHKLPAKLISIDTAHWTYKSVYVKDVIYEEETPIMDCVAISDDLFLVAMMYSYAVFNKELNEISTLLDQENDIETL